MRTLSIRGRIYYEDTCLSCGADRGFVRKQYLGKRCKSCAGRTNRLGSPSPMKGIKKCWSLDNLKPMWAVDNMSKGARYAD